MREKKNGYLIIKEVDIENGMEINSIYLLLIEYIIICC